MAARGGASARRFAEAVFSLASERSALVAWGGDLATIAAFVGGPDVAALLASNRIPRDEKMRLLRAGLESHISSQAMNLVRILNERGKLHLASTIRAAFLEMVDEASGVAHATVTTAVSLSEDEHSAIATRLSTLVGKRVDVTPVVDPAILGGLVARIGDQLIDASTRSKLVALKRRLGGAAR